MVMTTVTCAYECYSNDRNSNAGHEELPSFLSRGCVASFIKPFTQVINTSLNFGIFLAQLKMTKIVPVFNIIIGFIIPIALIFIS